MSTSPTPIARPGSSTTLPPMAKTASETALLVKFITFVYPVAPVSVNSSEWVFAAAYSRAQAQGDHDAARRIGDAYLPYMRAVFAWAEQLSLDLFGRPIPHVLLLHANEPIGHAYPGKERQPAWDLYDLIRSAPETTFILAHWGGGLWFYLLLKREVSQVFENVYVDTAASPFLYRPEIYRYAREILGVEKILFGSDYPLLTADRYLKEMEAAGVAAADRRAILGQNAQRLLAWPPL